MPTTSPSNLFARFAKAASRFTGRPASFAIALLLIVVWIASGPLFDFSDTWQLVINTGTTIITFLMVFLIQSSQNSDTAAMQLKLDELIRVTSKAQNVLIDLEEAGDEEVDELKKQYQELARQAHNGAGETPSRQNNNAAPAESAG